MKPKARHKHASVQRHAAREVILVELSLLIEAARRARPTVVPVLLAVRGALIRER